MIGETILTIVFSIVVLIFVVAIMKIFVQSILEKELGEFLISGLAIMSVVGVVLLLFGI